MTEGTVYQGILTAQLRKIAARASKVISVTTALPFWKKRPPTAGNSAKPRGMECQCEGSWWLVSGEPDLYRGRSRSSVDERRDLRVSERPSEKIELLLRFNDVAPSVNVAVLLRPRWRSCEGGGLICLVF
jgi:hypothetical protein